MLGPQDALLLISKFFTRPSTVHKTHYNRKMLDNIVFRYQCFHGFQAAFVIAWITFCMFCKERHKSETYQYNISDLRRRNYQFAQEQIEEKSDTKEVTAGIFIMPSRHKTHKDDYSYEKRPDYPEGTLANLQPRTDRLIEIIDNPTDGDRKCVDFDLDSSVPYHSDV